MISWILFSRIIVTVGGERGGDDEDDGQRSTKAFEIAGECPARINFLFVNLSR